MPTAESAQGVHPAAEARIEAVDAAAYTVPTDAPESDGTLAWDRTTIVVVHARAGGLAGLGYSYTHAVAADLIRETLAPEVVGVHATAPPAAWDRMMAAVRNLGQPGLAASAISAVDTALWDLKARVLGLPLSALFGQVREATPVYGSGGFTSYGDSRLREQLVRWAGEGITRFKIKVGRDAAVDPRRVRLAREAVGPEAELYVDANGGYARKQAVAMAHRFAAEAGVTWFEEPRPSDDLDGLRMVRDQGPPGMEVAAGEYGYTPPSFKRLLDAGAVDCLQADATRCGGYTGFLVVAGLCEAALMPLSAHTAPQLHAHVCGALRPVRHIELFHDHARIEAMLFEGALAPRGGELRPDPARPGNGLTLNTDAADRFAA